ncbi:MAG: hypothetical protein JZU53_16125 [Paludibacter sp.]|nr:hypothetical protein [Paludibacter sp.]
MFNKIGATLQWLPHYYARELRRTIQGERVPPKHVYFCICDHFEPYWNGADKTTARKRIQRWLDEYPKIADKYRDSDGNRLKYSFFYPEEEYQVDDLNALAELCHAGYGEVEIHLHHDNDTSENLRRTLIDFKHRLHEKHGLLSIDKKTGEIVYGFIHGNWSLCNSRRDGRWCGVNDELKILQETGCYADFTLPSAPSDTQTRKVNSIYYAVDKPDLPKSHDWGVDAEVGKSREGLLMVQGPLALNFSNRKNGIFPRIENSGLFSSSPPTFDRVKLWIDTGVCVKGAPEHVFVKLYTHGTQENIMKMLFDDGGMKLFFEGIEHYKNDDNMSVHFLSAKGLVDKVESILSASKGKV